PARDREITLVVDDPRVPAVVPAAGEGGPGGRRVLEVPRHEELAPDADLALGGDADLDARARQADAAGLPRQVLPTEHGRGAGLGRAVHDARDGVRERLAD